MFYSFVFFFLSRRIKYKRIVLPSMETIESRIRRAVNSIRKFQNNFLLPQTLSGFTALKCQEPFPSKRKLHNYRVSISCSIFCGYILHIYIYRVIQNFCRGTIVQRQFRTEFGKQPPSDNSIRKCYGQFQETERERECVCVCVCVYPATEGTKQNLH
jgi:hypothetical protein